MQVVSVQTEENANQAIVAQVAIGYYNEPQPVIPHIQCCATMPSITRIQVAVLVAPLRT